MHKLLTHTYIDRYRQTEVKKCPEVKKWLLQDWTWSITMHYMMQTSRKPTVLSPQPVKQAEVRWKLLLWRSCCPIKKNPCGEPLYRESNVKKMRSCKTVGGPVKPGFFTFLPVLRSGNLKVRKFSRCLYISSQVKSKVWTNVTLTKFIASPVVSGLQILHLPVQTSLPPLGRGPASFMFDYCPLTGPSH